MFANGSQLAMTLNQVNSDGMMMSPTITIEAMTLEKTLRRSRRINAKMVLMADSHP